MTAPTPAAARARARARPTGATTGTPTHTATGSTGTTINTATATATTARTRTRSTAMTALAATPGIDVMKQVNRQFVTGVTVVTAMDGETPRGLAVNAFSSISLDPATVMVCVQRTSSTHDCLFRAGHLAINILSTGQLDVVGVFAGKSADKFRQVDWESGPFGSPLLTGSSARVEAEIRERLQASTHTIFICRVVHADVAEWPPMVYGAGKFFDGGALAPLG
ncbi:flavin reductase family protein [Streptomyces carpaticus]|uniref:flavin reductase family protein n=1 Tax=Streptomyces carpaticus TaxID=285558 RepID=UPI0031F98913